MRTMSTVPSQARQSKPVTEKQAEAILLSSLEWLNLYSLPLDSDAWFEMQQAKSIINCAIWTIKFEGVK